jgi:hypothetical protein
MMNIAFGEKNRVSHLRHRTSRTVRLANGQAQHNPIPGALPQAMMNIAVGEKTGYRIGPSNIATGSIGQRPCTT